MCRRRDDIKVDLRETGCVRVCWTQVAKDIHCTILTHNDIIKFPCHSWPIIKKHTV
jgi:hypothetical protein